MIKLKGPRKANRGEWVCLQAGSIGPGFTAKATGPHGSIDVTVKIDPRTHTATICFHFPNDAASVGIDVADSTGARQSHVVQAR